MKNKEHFNDYSKRALFLHIPKTAGSSMSAAPFILMHGSHKIAPTTEYLLSLPLRFSFVRNPYDRYASVLLNLGFATPETFEDFTINTFAKEHEKRMKENDLDWQPLWTMTKRIVFDGKLEVDFVGRFENLQKDWKKVCKVMDYDFPLPHLNKSKWKGYDQFYTPRLRSIVGLAYAKDFARFGYERR